MGVWKPVDGDLQLSARLQRLVTHSSRASCCFAKNPCGLISSTIALDDFDGSERTHSRCAMAKEVFHMIFIDQLFTVRETPLD